MRGLGKGQTLRVMIVDEVYELIQKVSNSGNILFDLAAWLCVNSMKSEKLQHLALSFQQVSNVFRKKAFTTLFTTSAPATKIEVAEKEQKEKEKKELLDKLENDFEEDAVESEEFDNEEDEPELAEEKRKEEAEEKKKKKIITVPVDRSEAPLISRFRGSFRSEKAIYDAFKEVKSLLDATDYLMKMKKKIREQNSSSVLCGIVRALATKFKVKGYRELTTGTAPYKTYTPLYERLSSLMRRAGYKVDSKVCLASSFLVDPPLCLIRFFLFSSSLIGFHGRLQQGFPLLHLQPLQPAWWLQMRPLLFSSRHRYSLCY
jgi:hypothetical protein